MNISSVLRQSGFLATLLLAALTSQLAFSFEIRVNWNTGGVYGLSIDAESTDTIATVKSKIEAVTGVPPSDQTLIGQVSSHGFTGLLDDTRTLGSYGVAPLNGGTTPPTINMSGGSPPSGSGASDSSVGPSQLANLLGGVSQASIHSGSFQFQLLRSRIQLLFDDPDYFRRRSSAGFPRLSATEREPSLIQPVSFEETRTIELSSRDSHSCQQGRQCKPRRYGWLEGYGTGGQADARGTLSGFDYAAAGTSLGIFRKLSDQTAVGMFGNYGYQDIDANDGSRADINSGMLGAFLYRRDQRKNYYILAANAGYNHHKTTRKGGIQGDFDGMQTGLMLERGWTRRWRQSTILPSISLQNIWVHLDDHVETGTGGASVDEIDEFSLRSVVGATLIGPQHRIRQSAYSWKPTLRVHWMHEFLDTTTGVSGSINGTSFALQGLDLGRDWAILGMGIMADRGSNLTTYFNYDLQVNDHSGFHTGSFGVVWRR